MQPPGEWRAVNNSTEEEGGQVCFGSTGSTGMLNWRRQGGMEKGGREEREKPNSLERVLQRVLSSH